MGVCRGVLQLSIETGSVGDMVRVSSDITRETETGDSDVLKRVALTHTVCFEN